MIKDSLEWAKSKDLAPNFRSHFELPTHTDGSPLLYFAGHSLGPLPKKVREYVGEEIEAWSRLGVEGHFHAKHPWLPYHEFLTESFARLVGAHADEVVAMNTLTVNLHLMMVSFYRPTKTKYKIIIENNTFPSDKYAVDSQARFHGHDPKEAIIELRPREGELSVREEDLLEQINKHGPELALVMLGNCNYLSGQRFDFEAITKLAHSHGAKAGFNLAHGAGNLLLKLHDWNVDFAVWCSYKYLNSGPGGIAGAFVHRNHLGQKDLPRFEGWWGHDKKTRFKMGPDFSPIGTVEAWQLSNPPILPLAALRASMEIFDQATMPALRERGDELNSYLEELLLKKLSGRCHIVTPKARGNMLCVRINGAKKEFVETLKERGAIVDFREPDIFRIAPAPLYTSFEDVYRLANLLEEIVHA
jgi:kynureninase